MLEIAKEWQDYELIDAGEEEKLERWGRYVLLRPDPQAIWPKNPQVESLWRAPDLYYHRSSKGGGYWENRNNVPDSWDIKYKELTFEIKPTAFKHTGLFPEQSSNWEWFTKIIQNSSSDFKVLNLFAYTGGATVAAAKAGAKVCHIDSSKGMTNIAKRNIELSNLQDKGPRFIIDDAVKFVKREIRRGNKYEGIIMDPPVYGRGPTGELWRIEENLNQLIELCMEILSDKAKFFLINAYATSFSNVALQNLLTIYFKERGGKITSGELGLPIKGRDIVLPSGLFGRWEK